MQSNPNRSDDSVRKALRRSNTISGVGLLIAIAGLVAVTVGHYSIHPGFAVAVLVITGVLGLWAGFGVVHAIYKSR